MSWLDTATEELLAAMEAEASDVAESLPSLAGEGAVTGTLKCLVNFLPVLITVPSFSSEEELRYFLASAASDAALHLANRMRTAKREAEPAFGHIEMVPVSSVTGLTEIIAALCDRALGRYYGRPQAAVEQVWDGLAPFEEITGGPAVPAAAVARGPEAGVAAGGAGGEEVEPAEGGAAAEANDLPSPPHSGTPVTFIRRVPVKLGLPCRSVLVLTVAIAPTSAAKLRALYGDREEGVFGLWLRGDIMRKFLSRLLACCLWNGLRPRAGLLNGRHWLWTEDQRDALLSDERTAAGKQPEFIRSSGLSLPDLLLPISGIYNDLARGPGDIVRAKEPPSPPQYFLSVQGCVWFDKEPAAKFVKHLLYFATTAGIGPLFTPGFVCISGHATKKGHLFPGQKDQSLAGIDLRPMTLLVETCHSQAVVEQILLLHVQNKGEKGSGKDRDRLGDPRDSLYGFVSDTVMSVAGPGVELAAGILAEATNVAEGPAVKPDDWNERLSSLLKPEIMQVPQYRQLLLQNLGQQFERPTRAHPQPELWTAGLGPSLTLGLACPNPDARAAADEGFGRLPRAGGGAGSNGPVQEATASTIAEDAVPAVALGGLVGRREPLTLEALVEESVRVALGVLFRPPCRSLNDLRALVEELGQRAAMKERFKSADYLGNFQAYGEMTWARGAPEELSLQHVFGDTKLCLVAMHTGTGSGDALMVTDGDGHYHLIDGGQGAKEQLKGGRCHHGLLRRIAQLAADDDVAAEVKPVLKSWSLACTHPDKDHLGGAYLAARDLLTKLPDDKDDEDLVKQLRDKFHGLYFNTPWTSQSLVDDWDNLEDVAGIPVSILGSARLQATAASRGKGKDDYKSGLVHRCVQGDGAGAAVTMRLGKAVMSSANWADGEVPSAKQDGLGELTLRWVGPSQARHMTAVVTEESFASDASANASSLVSVISRGARHLLTTGDAHLNEDGAAFSVALKNALRDAAGGGGGAAGGGGDAQELRLLQLPHHGSTVKEECFGPEAARIMLKHAANGAIFLMSGVSSIANHPPSLPPTQRSVFQYLAEQMREGHEPTAIHVVTTYRSEELTLTDEEAKKAGTRDEKGPSDRRLRQHLQKVGKESGGDKLPWEFEQLAGRGDAAGWWSRCLVVKAPVDGDPEKRIYVHQPPAGTIFVAFKWADEIPPTGDEDTVTGDEVASGGGCLTRLVVSDGWKKDWQGDLTLLAAGKPPAQ